MSGNIDGRMNMVAEGDTEIIVTRDFAAPRDRVLDAMVDPGALQTWLSGPPGWSMVVCDVEKKVGGKYRFVWSDGNGAEMVMSGIYREYDPPTRVVNTQLFDEEMTGGEVIGTLVVTEKDGKTYMTNTLRYPSREARDAVMGSPMGFVMAQGYTMLDGYLAAAVH